MSEPGDKERTILYDRLAHVRFLWEQRCVQGQRNGRLESPRVHKRTMGPVTILNIDPDEPLRSEAALLRNLATSPGTWQYVSPRTGTRGRSGRHARGRRLQHRRDALLRLWLQVLITGDVLPADLPRIGVSRPTVTATWVRKGVNRVMHLGRDAQTRGRLIAPTATGQPQGAALGRMVRRRLDAYQALPASATVRTIFDTFQTPLWAVTPAFLADAAWVRRQGLSQVKLVRTSNDLERGVARVLETDLRKPAWPLWDLTRFIVYDAAADWFQGLKSAKAREGAIAARRLVLRQDHIGAVLEAYEELGLEKAVQFRLLMDGGHTLATGLWAPADVAAARRLLLAAHRTSTSQKDAALAAINLAALLEKEHPREGAAWRKRAVEAAARSRAAALRQAAAEPKLMPPIAAGYGPAPWVVL